MALVEHDAPVVSHVSSTSPVVSTAATTDEGTASAASGGQAGGSPPPLPAPATPPWNLDRINQRAMPLDLAFSAGKSAGAGVTIYVVDTGIRSTHSEFRRAGGGASRARPGIDLVSDATTADCPPGVACDCDGHGSHVAGVVGGLSVGIAPASQLVSVRVLDCSGQGNISDVLAGLDYVARVAARPSVVTLSLGVPKGDWSSALAAAVGSLVDTRGIFVTVAAGNAGGDSCSLVPASVPQALTVGASSISGYFKQGGLPPAGQKGVADSLYSWTDTGPCVSLFAPGVNVLSACGGVNRCSTPSDTTYALATGTSMAAPHVAGVAAALLSASPNASPAAIRSALLGSATPNALPNASMLPSTPNLLLFATPIPSASQWQTVAQALAGSP